MTKMSEAIDVPPKCNIQTFFHKKSFIGKIVGKISNH